MRRATATLVLGLTIGIVGIMLYNRMRAAANDEDPEVLLDKLSQKLQDLENTGPALTEPSMV